ncbi:MAG: trypsin-like peptidase domain-containing protein [Gammaproteobacteria bacterium]|nr:trypsin-like peptidase domain-containing protein [Gammaproteobacteria bacterium]
MQIRRLLPYLSQGVIVGLAVGLIAVFVMTDTFTKRPVVEFKEAAQNETAAAPQATVSYAGAVSKAAPAVVNIHTTKTVTRQLSPLLDDPFFRRFFNAPDVPREQQQTSLGSGVIVSTDGYVLTNNHVIDGSDEILVALNDGRSAPANVIGTDPESDIAVLKIALNQLSVITLGDSNALQVGDVVLAIGNPFGVGQTVTQGIVSATGRSQLGISTFENFIQTDAAINPGNSGGALIDPYGRLVGINTAIFSRSGGSQGIGFAIPTSLAKNVMTQIIEHGEAIRGWLGVEIQTLTPALAESFGLRDRQGLIIAGVFADGPAAAAGLEAGDIITDIDGAPVTEASIGLNMIAQTKPGSRITLQGLHQGEPFSREVTVSKRPLPAR